MRLFICKSCERKWCGTRKCDPRTCDFRFLCIKTAKIDFCSTCQLRMLEEFEKQVRKYIVKRVRTEGGP